MLECISSFICPALGKSCFRIQSEHPPRLSMDLFFHLKVVNLIINILS